MAAGLVQQAHLVELPASLISEEDDEELREMFLQCIEIQGGQASLAELAMLFCRSRFAGEVSLFLDFYGESVEVWQLSRPLVLRRYLLKYEQSFAVFGIEVSSLQEKKIPEQLLQTVWYLKRVILENFSGTAELPSLVQTLRVDSAFASSVAARVIGETKDEVRRFVLACYSVFKLDQKKDVVYVVGAETTLVEAMDKHAVAEILKKLQEKPRKISDLISCSSQNVPVATSYMHKFLLSFPFVFEVKKDNLGFDGRVFSLRKHQSPLYTALEESSQNKDISSQSVVERFQLCLKLLRNNWGWMDLNSQLENFTSCSRLESSQLTRTAIGSDRLEVVNFLSVFPSVFSIEGGQVILEDENGDSAPECVKKLAREALLAAEIKVSYFKTSQVTLIMSSWFGQSFSRDVIKI